MWSLAGQWHHVYDLQPPFCATAFRMLSKTVSIPLGIRREASDEIPLAILIERKLPDRVKGF